MDINAIIAPATAGTLAALEPDIVRASADAALLDEGKAFAELLPDEESLTDASAPTAFDLVFPALPMPERSALISVGAIPQSDPEEAISGIGVQDPANPEAPLPQEEALLAGSIGPGMDMAGLMPDRVDPASSDSSLRIQGSSIEAVPARLSVPPGGVEDEGTDSPTPRPAAGPGMESPPLSAEFPARAPAPELLPLPALPYGSPSLTGEWSEQVQHPPKVTGSIEHGSMPVQGETQAGPGSTRVETVAVAIPSAQPLPAAFMEASLHEKAGSRSNASGSPAAGREFAALKQLPPVSVGQSTSAFVFRLLDVQVAEETGIPLDPSVWAPATEAGQSGSRVAAQVAQDLPVGFGKTVVTVSGDPTELLGTRSVTELQHATKPAKADTPDMSRFQPMLPNAPSAAPTNAATLAIGPFLQTMTTSSGLVAPREGQSEPPMPAPPARGANFAAGIPAQLVMTVTTSLPTGEPQPAQIALPSDAPMPAVQVATGDARDKADIPGTRQVDRLGAGEIALPIEPPVAVDAAARLGTSAKTVVDKDGLNPAAPVPPIAMSLPAAGTGRLQERPGNVQAAGSAMIKESKDKATPSGQSRQLPVTDGHHSTTTLIRAQGPAAAFPAPPDAGSAKAVIEGTPEPRAEEAREELVSLPTPATREVVALGEAALAKVPQTGPEAGFQPRPTGELGVMQVAVSREQPVDDREVVPNSPELPTASPAKPGDIAGVIVTAGLDRAEINLDPAELGRLRFELIQSGDRVNVILTVERPETQDLLRRNLDQLAQEFRDQGLKDATLSFGTWGQSDHAAPRQNPDPSGTADANLVGTSPELDSATPITRLDHDRLLAAYAAQRGGIDIRV